MRTIKFDSKKKKKKGTENSDTVASLLFRTQKNRNFEKLYCIVPKNERTNLKANGGFPAPPSNKRAGVAGLSMFYRAKIHAEPLLMNFHFTVTSSPPICPYESLSQLVGPPFNLQACLLCCRLGRQLTKDQLDEPVRRTGPGAIIGVQDDKRNLKGPAPGSPSSLSRTCAIGDMPCTRNQDILREATTRGLIGTSKKSLFSSISRRIVPQSMPSRLRSVLNQTRSLVRRARRTSRISINSYEPCSNNWQ